MAKGSFSTAMDATRVGACFMVVLLHVSAMNFGTLDDHWWASNVYDSLTRSCVPVFLMISGVLLLGKHEALSVFFRKRFSRILPPLLFWSLFYMASNAWQGKDYGAWPEWVRRLASGPVEFHLWYLYAIVGIYLFVPFLRRIWSASSPGEKKAYLALWVLASAWPTVRAALGIDVDLRHTYDLGSFFGLAGYLFLGAYVHEMSGRHVDREWYWWANLALYLFFSVLIMTATYLYSKQSGSPQTLFYDYLSPLVMASSVCVFNVLYGLGARSVPHAGLLRKISACTLGIYCVHVFVLHQVESATGLVGTDSSAWWAIPAMAAVVFAVSLAVVLPLRRLKPFALVT
jgi:surface polysaccharide O-acyltransferase-like enzyme